MFPRWFWALALWPVFLGAAEPVSVVNVGAQELGGLGAAAEALGLAPAPVRPDSVKFSGKLVIWEAREGKEAAPAALPALAEHVRTGGGLLVTLPRKAGEMPMRSATFLPTTAWMTRSSHLGDAVTFSTWDAEMFGSAPPAGLELPWHQEIRPWHAAERGQGRYEPYVGLIKDILTPALPLSPAKPFWTRPLINRDWQVRVRGAGLKQPPLLLTGRYGAGRAAVFAADVAAMADTPAARAFWTGVLKWLAESVAMPSAAGELPAPITAIDVPRRVLKVTITNPLKSAMPVRVLGRIMTWEPALVGDVEKDVTLQPKGSATVELPLPAVTPTSFAAVQARDAWVVRLGVLSGNGAELLSESRIRVDLRPTATLSVTLPEVRSVPWPYPNAPEPGLHNRMGLPMPTYACRPGEKTEVEVVLDNTGRNLAPLAAVRDETDLKNASVAALTDGSALAERKTEWFLQHYGAWEGQVKQENVVSFTFEHPMRINLITLNGTPDEYRNQNLKNPQSVIVEIDGQEAVREPKLASRFSAEGGIVRLPISGVTGKVVRLRLPWPNPTGRAATPTLGEVEIFGTDGAASTKAGGTVSLTVVDALTGTSTPLKQEPVEIAPGERKVLRLPLQVPAGAKPGFYRIEAKFGEQTAAAPLLAIAPTAPLQPIDSLVGKKSVEMGFIVTRGFRNFFDTAVGTSEIHEGWGQPDDLVWAYARGLKQNSARARDQAGRLYVACDNLAHYSSPWRHFYNGEDFYDVATPLLVRRAQESRDWQDAETVVLGFSDRWDTGPDPDACYGWPEFEAFNDWLREHRLGALKGRTLAEIAHEIDTTLKTQWSAFHLERYVHRVGGLHDAFAAEKKTVIIRGQGAPVIPPGEAAAITRVVRGSSDDCTWGMISENLPATTGRQMGALAFTPTLAMSTLAHWGYISNTLGNMQWHGPIATTEPNRRMLYDRAFRGTIRPDGSYGSIHTYGYNSNAGDPYTLTGIDYDQWNRVRTLHTMLTPEAPLGAGLIIANDYLDDPRQTRFNGTEAMGMEEVRTVSRAVELLQNQGVSVPFAANVLSLEKWRGSAPLIVLNLQRCTDREIAILRAAAARGVKLVAFCATQPLPEHLAIKGCLTVPLDPNTMSAADLRKIALALASPLTFPEGTAGYGFVSNGRSFVVLEDWSEAARLAPLRIHGEAGWKGLRAVNVNDHTTLATHRDGEGWIIDVPVAPGAGVLVTFEAN